MDKIIINGLNVYAYHGVNESEKINGQNFVIDMILHTNYSRACLSDDLKDTVSYATIIKRVCSMMIEHKYDLIEAAAYHVIEGIFAEFSAIMKIELTLKKPEAPISSAIFDYVGVSLSRERESL